MFTRILATAVLLLAAAGDSQAQDCPEDCTRTIMQSSSGTIPSGVVFVVTPLVGTDGTGAWAVPVGGGAPQCVPCRDCTQRLRINWSVPTGSTKCIAYNHCGYVQNGPGSGMARFSLTSACGDLVHDEATDIDFEIGDCNPSWNPMDCGNNPPIIQPPDYTLEMWLKCDTCQ